MQNTENKIENIMQKIAENLLELQKIGTSEDVLKGCDLISKNIRSIKYSIKKVNGGLNDNMTIDTKRGVVHSEICKLKARNKRLTSELSSKNTTEFSKSEINDKISKNQIKIDNLKIVFYELDKKKNVSVSEFRQYMDEKAKKNKEKTETKSSFNIKNKSERMRQKLLAVYTHEYELLKNHKNINDNNRDAITKWKKQLTNRIKLLKKSLNNVDDKKNDNIQKPIFDINICIYQQTSKFKINKEIKLPKLESVELCVNIKNENNDKTSEFIVCDDDSDDISNDTNTNSQHSQPVKRKIKVKTKKNYDPVTKARMNKLFNMILFTKDYIERSPELDMFIMKETKERLQSYSDEYRELSANYIRNDNLVLS